MFAFNNLKCKIFCISTLLIKTPWISLVSLSSGHAGLAVSLQSSRDAIRRKASSRHTHTRSKIFWISTASIKIFCIQQFQMQNIFGFDSLDQTLLGSTASNIKYFALIFCNSNAPDQNPLGLIGFLVIGSCRILAATLHPSPDRRPHSSFYWQQCAV
jgi:hypothetical protein